MFKKRLKKNIQFKKISDVTKKFFLQFVAIININNCYKLKNKKIYFISFARRPYKRTSGTTGV